MVSERAALCEVPECFGGDGHGRQSGFSPFTSYPPKLTQLNNAVNRRGSYGYGDGSYSKVASGYDPGRAGYGQAGNRWR